MSFIIIAGNIGAGKSTLSAALGELFSLKVYQEPYEENPYLSDFYRDPRTWAYRSQLFFLNKAFEEHRELMVRGGVQDRGVYEHFEVFAKSQYRAGYLTDDQFQYLKTLFEEELKSLSPPHLLVYLKASPKLLKERISKRGRGMELAASLEYLSNLNDHYEALAKNWNRSPLLELEIGSFDLPNDNLWLKSQVEPYLKG